MARIRIRLLLALVAGWCGAGLLLAPAAVADVDCADLVSSSSAQSYLESHPGDPDRLDADHDGTACEGNPPRPPGGRSLLALGALLALALARYTVGEAWRQRRHRPAGATPAAPVPPSRASLVDTVAASAGHKQTLVIAAPSGSPEDLARALRLVPPAARMAMVEEHAAAHGTGPQEVLDGLVAALDDTADLDLQGWALAGYEPRWTVRVLPCPCVGGARNHKLRRAPDGTRSWSCASCRALRHVR